MDNVTLELKVSGDHVLVDAIMGSPNAKRGSETPAPGGARLRYEGTLFQEAAGAPEVARFILHMGGDVGVGVVSGLLSAWLYDRLKAGQATKLRIDRVDVELKQGAIERIITERLRPRGPYAYENWLAAVAGGPFEGGFEFPLYSDAEFRAQANKFWGPYTLFNTLSGPSPYNSVRPIFVLGVDLHLKPSDLVDRDAETTDVERYLGGGPELEMAALCSLAMGIRLKPGGMTRVFNKQSEYPRGLPYGADVEGATRRTGGLATGILPEVLKFEVRDVDRVATYPLINPEQAIALARVAKLYQDAVWVAEGEAALSWLFLVSAIETAADSWYGADKRSPAAELRELRPEVAQRLQEAGGNSLVEDIAGHFAGTLGALKKFASFVLEFLPETPKTRPPLKAQVSWSPDEMKRFLKVIYGLRSKALHDGIPFPPVMCERPYQAPDWEAPAEAPVEDVYRNAYGVWKRENTPMLLHTFEHVARGALLKWWDSMVSASSSKSAG